MIKGQSRRRGKYELSLIMKSYHRSILYQMMYMPVQWNICLFDQNYWNLSFSALKKPISILILSFPIPLLPPTHQANFLSVASLLSLSFRFVKMFASSICCLIAQLSHYPIIARKASCWIYFSGTAQTSSCTRTDGCLIQNAESTLVYMNPCLTMELGETLSCPRGSKMVTFRASSFLPRPQCSLMYITFNGVFMSVLGAASLYDVTAGLPNLQPMMEPSAPPIRKTCESAFHMLWQPSIFNCQSAYQCIRIYLQSIQDNSISWVFQTTSFQ